LGLTAALGCGATPTAKKPAKKKITAKPVSTQPIVDFPKVDQNAYASVDDAFSRVPPLVKSTDPNVGQELLKVETWLQQQGPTIAPQLTGKIKDANEDLAIRLTACRVISKLGAIATPTLLDALALEPRQLRLKATECLGRVKPADGKSIKKLIALIDDKDFDQRKIAIAALAQIGPPAKEAVPKLLSILNDTNEDETIRGNAKHALKLVDPRKGLMNAH